MLSALEAKQNKYHVTMEKLIKLPDKFISQEPKRPKYDPPKNTNKKFIKLK